MDDVIIQGYGCTDIGLHRSINEDYFNMNETLFVVADGMGGHNAGDIASKLSVESIMSYIDESMKSNSKKKTTISDNKHLIYNAFIQANETVHTQSLEYIEYHGMGTTLIVAFFQTPNIFHIANIGDSRVYLLRDTTLTQLTKDDSVTANMVRNGLLTENEAKNHPYRHHLSQSIGTSQLITPHMNSIKVIPKDKLLLCTDGLWNVLSNQELTDILQQNSNVSTICHDLIQKAIQLKSRDNITCIVISIEKK